jgi:hypothetical protein
MPFPALRQLVAIVTLSLTVLTGSAQIPSTAKPSAKAEKDSTELIILKIRKEYAGINADSKKYRLVLKDIMGLSAEGGELKSYYDGKDLKKSVLIFYGEMGKSLKEYYFAGGQVFFCYERHTEYDKPIYMKDMHIEKIEENRYYFTRGKMIRWVGTSGKIVPSDQYAEKTQVLLPLWKEAFYMHEE